MFTPFPIHVLTHCIYRHVHLVPPFCRTSSSITRTLLRYAMCSHSHHGKNKQCSAKQLDLCPRTEELRHQLETRAVIAAGKTHTTGRYPQGRQRTTSMKRYRGGAVDLEDSIASRCPGFTPAQEGAPFRRNMAPSLRWLTPRPPNVAPTDPA